MVPLSLSATVLAEVLFPWWQCSAHTPVSPLGETGSLQQATQKLNCFWPETPAARDDTPRHSGLQLTPETCQISKLQGAKTAPDRQPSKWEEASLLCQPSHRLQAARKGEAEQCCGTREAGGGDNAMTEAQDIKNLTLRHRLEQENARLFFVSSNKH